MRSKRDSEADQQTLHIMRDCAIHMPISIGLEKNSPIKGRVDTLLRRIVESGLTEKWLRDAKQSYESSIEPDPQEALMELRKFYGAIVALGIGYVIALITLIGEVIYWNCIVVKHPMYDKYLPHKFYSQTIKK